ncbi:MAG: tyrosine-type recombinase/integrase [Vulcanimicrobiota bacterium]
MDELRGELWSERFAQWMRLRNGSIKSIETYQMGLRQFFTYLKDQGVVSLAAITRDLVEGFRTHLFYRRHKGKPLSVATQACRLTAVKSFLRYLVRENVLLADVASTVDLPKKQKTLPRVLAEDEVARVLQGPDLDTLTGIRDRALLETLYATALRNGELGALQLEDLDWDGRALWVRLGKGQKDRVVPIGDEALAWLEEYLRRVRPRWVTREDEKHLFLHFRGGRLGHELVRKIVVRYAKTAGLQGVTPHTLRHSCATHMLARGAGLRHLQVMLGHSSLVTTQHYTRLDLSDLHKVLRRCHPREARSFS